MILITLLDAVLVMAVLVTRHPVVFTVLMLLAVAICVLGERTSET